MMKSLAIFGSLSVSALCSANAFALSRSEVWMMKNKGGVHREFYVADDSSGSAAGYHAAERDLQSRGEDTPNISPNQAADLARDCITNVEDIHRAEQIVIEVVNALTGGIGDKTIIAGFRRVSDMLSDYDARNCYRLIEDKGVALPEDVQRRYFPERFGGSPSSHGGSSSGCFGAGGCPD